MHMNTRVLKVANFKSEVSQVSLLTSEAVLRSSWLRRFCRASGCVVHSAVRREGGGGGGEAVDYSFPLRQITDAAAAAGK